MSRYGPGPGSIARTLLKFIALPLAILVLISAIVSAIMTNRSVNRLYDQQMQSIAEVLLSFVLYETKEIEDDDDDDRYENDDEDEFDEELLEVVSSIQNERGLPVNFRLSINGNTIFTSTNLSLFPDCVAGYSRMKHPEPEVHTINWHCYRQDQSLLGAGYNASVEVFEPAQQRKHDVRSLVAATFSPLFLLPILVLLLTTWAVSYSMRSLKKVSNDVAQRSVNNLQRLPVKRQPEELLPVVQSVNDLLDGIERGLQREKQFTDDAAHELRTPLTSIKMLEQLLRRDNKDPDLSEYLDSLRDSVDQSNDLIEQLLGFARLQSVKALDMNSLNLVDSVYTQLGLLSPQITSKNLSVKFKKDVDELNIQANEAAINVLLNNILTNAIKFSPDHGVIYVSLSRIELKIEDDGPGIAAEDRLRVFDRFYRGADSHSHNGSGLGLALAKWVADAHHFSLYLDSPSLGTGAAFVINFSSGYQASHSGK